MKSEREPTIYRIPEGREPSLFDYIVQKIIPGIFKFTEYLTLSGFIYFLALKTKNYLLSVFACILYGCIMWYVMDKHIAFVKKLEFRNVWVMRATSWVLVVIGMLLLLGALALVSQIATAQLGK